MPEVRALAEAIGLIQFSPDSEAQPDEEAE